MGLQAGTKLGPYEIQSLLGAGGMGEVYRARDTRLNRTVAVKVLPSHLAQKAEARDRFEREARAISALNHPYICQLYDVGEQDGHNYLVMEYLEGQTLASRLFRGRLPLDLALRYGAEITDALAAAHRRGIVHRDLKPGNTFLTEHGECKVLDFGLAKLEEVEVDDQAPTAGMTAPNLLTTPGSAVGTAAYMSPEQVRGDDLDPRTDIFSFGIMLYQMVTGTLPFSGKTSGAIADSILNRHPEPPASLNPEIPPELERILGKALEKDRDLRYQSATELRADLKRMQRDTLEKTAPAASGSVSGGWPQAQSRSFAARSLSSARAAKLIGSVALVILVIAAAWWFRLRTRPSAVEPLSFTRLSEEGELASSANISPDGKYVVYETIDHGKHSLWLRHTATFAIVRVVPETEHDFETGYDGTTFSPDDNFIYFLHTIKGESQHALYTVPALGGIPRKILANIDTPVTFSPDGKQIAFVRHSTDTNQTSLLVAFADGSGERVLCSTDNSQQYFSNGGPSWSPDGERIAIIADHVAAHGSFSDMELIDMSGHIHSLGRIPANERGRVAWMGDGSGILFTGYPSEAAERWQIFFMSYPGGAISRITNDMDSYGSFSFGVSRDGSTLVTIQTSEIYHLWEAFAAGGYRKAEQIVRGQINRNEVGASAGKLVYAEDRLDGTSLWVTDLKSGSRVQVSDKGWTPRLSPDGKLVAFSAVDSQSQEHLWLVNGDGSGLRQLTTGNGDHLPTFSPDGQFIYYVHFTGAPSIYKIPATGGTPTRVSDMVAIPIDVSPDGKLLIVAYPDSKTGGRVWATMSVATGKVLQILPINGRQAFPVWMASGDALVYIETHDGVSNIWKLDLKGGSKTVLTHFDSEEIRNESISSEGNVFMVRGHGTATVVLMKNFRPQ